MAKLDKGFGNEHGVVGSLARENEGGGVGGVMLINS